MASYESRTTEQKPPLEQETLTLEQAIELALQHHTAGDLSKAKNIYQQILQTYPNQPVALQLFGVIEHQVGEHDRAVHLIRKAINIKPDYPEAHSNLGAALKELGRPEEAITCYHKALAIKPDYAEAHNNLGTALLEMERLDEAEECYHKALSIKPNYAVAHHNLGKLYSEKGQMEQAFNCQRRAVALNPENNVFWATFASYLETFSFDSVDDDLLPDLCNLIEKPTVQPSQIIRAVISALRQHPVFKMLLKSASNEAFDNVAYGDAAKQLSSVPLLLRTMELSVINDLEVERLFTRLRRSMLLGPKLGQGAHDKKCLPFSTALALNCFTNEYVFQETMEETISVDHLIEEIEIIATSGQEIPPALLATLAAYRPLCKFPWAKNLFERDWPNEFNSLIARQVKEPTDERSLLNQIPSLTPIQDTISQSVQDQYEENPYPRWIKTGLMEKGRAIGTILRSAPLRLDLGDYKSPDSPEILVAGCGTGQHALITASRFSNARVLAVDLSLSSLAYAMRKTNELGLSNIEYAQADIMELGTLGRQFDLIECAGVLHHLGDPLAGWRILVDLLRPDGIMMIGLYSKIARQPIVAGRSLIAEKGYTTSPEDIRRCRQVIISKANDGNLELAQICNYRDFFGVSMCRDLLFHVQEHHFTIPKIEANLQDLGLKFLGFELKDQAVRKRFEEFHPGKTARSTLSFWNKFETENPGVFFSMYQFWVQKI